MSYANEILENLILDGSVEIAGLSEDGEFMYNFTPELKNNHPDIFKEVLGIFHDGINNLWQKGFLQIDMTETDPEVYLIEESLTPENMDKLTEAERLLLESVLRQFNANQ